MVLVVGYILYSQSELVSREVRTLLDLPLSSRDAAEPEDEIDTPEAKPFAVSSENLRAKRTPVEPAAATRPADELPTAAKAGTDSETAKGAPVKTMELSSFEIPHETLMGLLQVAEKINEGSAGRAFYFPQGQSIAEAIQKSSRKLTAARTVPLQVGSQLELETPPTAPEAFQFALFAQQSKWDGKDGQLRFETNLILPQPETALEAETPTVRPVMDLALSGVSPMGKDGLVVILIEPPNRSPRAEFLTKAGEGPWTVFQSEEFRAGASDWAVLIQLK